MYTVHLEVKFEISWGGILEVFFPLPSPPSKSFFFWRINVLLCNSVHACVYCACLGVYIHARTHARFLWEQGTFTGMCCVVLFCPVFERPMLKRTGLTSGKLRDCMGKMSVASKRLFQTQWSKKLLL